MDVDDLQIVVEPLIDAGGYQYLATSPELPTLIVVGDTVDEVISLAPRVAAALLASMQADGDHIPTQSNSHRRGEP
jgi:predicted RNase H-like HicB family nuclease